MTKTTNPRFLLPLLAVALLVAAGPAGAVDFWLVAGPVPGGVTMPGGAVVPMWGYGLEPDMDFTTLEAVPQVPGPRLAVPVGDTTVNIHLYNNLAVPASIVIPGQIQATTVVRIPENDPDYPAPAGTGGRIRSFTTETAPGASMVYSWTAFRPGTFLYKSGTHQQVQVPMGLYGAITQDFATGPPAQVYAGFPYDTEIVALYSAVDPVLNAAVDGGTYGPGGTITSTLNSNPLYFLVNGHPYSTAVPIQYTAGAVGQTTLLRFLNASSVTIVPTLYGEDFQVVAEYGHPYPYPFTQYSVDMGAGATRDALFAPSRGGVYPVVDHTLHLTNAAAPDGGWIFKLAVTADPNQPVGTTDAYFIGEDPVAPLTVPAAGVLTNDSGGTGPLSAQLVQDVLHGTATLNPDGSFTYTPDPNYFGADFFLYQATDGSNTSEPVAAVIRVDPVNDPPVAVNDNLSLYEDLPLSLPAPGVLGNDIDVDGDTLSALLTSLPSHGTASLLSTGALTYTPNLNYFGPDSFQYEARDATTSGGIATVFVTVTAVNDVPLAVTDVLPFAHLNTPLVVNAPGVLVNDSDVEGSPLTAVLVNPPWHGGLVLNANGSLTYTPDTGFIGVDYFRYKANDGQLNSLAVKAWIIVSPLFADGFENGNTGAWSTFSP